LWGRLKKRWVVPVVFLLGGTAAAHTSSLPDTAQGYPPKKKFTHHEDLDYTFSAGNFLYLNWKHDKNANQVSLLQSLKFNFSVSADSIASFSGTFLHNLGFQTYFDSLSKFQSDDNTLNTRLDLRIAKNLNLSVLSTFATRIMNGYDYSLDSANRVIRTLNSSFCTPLVCTFSGGLALKWPALGSLSLGLASAKLTCLRDGSIFRKQNTDRFYGVPKGKTCLLEYGLSLQFLADKNVSKRLKWTCDLLLFKNYTAPVDVTLKNSIALKITQWLRTNFQTRIFYEEAVSRHVQIENILTFGFSFHL